MTTLAKLLGEKASAELNKTVIAAIDVKIAALRGEIEQLEASKKTFLDLIGEVSQPARNINNLFYLDSRTNGAGHFLEAIYDGSQLVEVRCSCKGYIYRGSCWASDHIENNLRKAIPDKSWRYVISDSGIRTTSEYVSRWEQRVRPWTTSLRIGPSV